MSDNSIKIHQTITAGTSLVKNLPSYAGDVGLIPGWRTKISHAKGQLSLSAATRESPSATTKIQCCPTSKKAPRTSITIGGRRKRRKTLCSDRK